MSKVWYKSTSATQTAIMKFPPRTGQTHKAQGAPRVSSVWVGGDERRKTALPGASPNIVEALERLGGQRTSSEIASAVGVRPGQVTALKEQAQGSQARTLNDGRTQAGQNAEAPTDRLYLGIVHLKGGPD